MRGKRAKLIRATIYGDYSYQLRKYDTKNGGRVCVGLRKQYQDSKREYIERKRDGSGC